MLYHVYSLGYNNRFSKLTLNQIPDANKSINLYWQRLPGFKIEQHPFPVRQSLPVKTFLLYIFFIYLCVKLILWQPLSFVQSCLPLRLTLFIYVSTCLWWLLFLWSTFSRAKTMALAAIIDGLMNIGSETAFNLGREYVEKIPLLLTSNNQVYPPNNLMCYWITAIYPVWVKYNSAIGKCCV